ncbi:MAG: RNA polymerase sigma factor [Candidatus Aminicenantes bacterium]|nr:RNA polymerase sigma factor [Candidatus Aminicenantes bacterium]
MAESIRTELVLPGSNRIGAKTVCQSEKDLLELVRAGDKKAYQSIVLRYMKSAYYVALGFLHNQQDALDVSQDAFIRAYRKRQTFDTERPFFPWFYRILRNMCIDYVKKYRRKDEVPLEDIPILDTQEEDSEMKQAVWKGIRELPVIHREVIILRYFRQMSYQEIAEVTGKPMGTVMSSLYYAKKNLKGILEKYYALNTEQ